MIIIEVLSGGLLVGVILLQRTKSQGLGGMAFGASIGESVFGSRAGNVLTKATVILGCLFLANTLFLAISYTHATAAAGGGRPRSVMETRGAMPQPNRVIPTPAPTAVPTAPPATPAPAPAAAPVAAPAAAPAAK
jgi:preprotein translocase subunit SecG